MELGTTQNRINNTQTKIEPTAPTIADYEATDDQLWISR